MRRVELRLGGVVGLFAAALLLALPLAAYGASAVRTSAFEYDSATGLLTKEIIEPIEPDSSNFCLVTTYSYNAFGGVVSTTTRNCSGTTGEAPAPTGDAVIASRTSSTGFDPKGQFATSSTNALNQSETRVYDPNFGGMTSLIGPNSLFTTWQYDSFGRKTLGVARRRYQDQGRLHPVQRGGQRHRLLSHCRFGGGEILRPGHTPGQRRHRQRGVEQNVLLSASTLIDGAVITLFDGRRSGGCCRT